MEIVLVAIKSELNMRVENFLSLLFTNDFVPFECTSIAT